MLTLYIDDITLRHLTQLQNLLQDSVTIYPQDEQSVRLISEGRVQARLLRLPDLALKRDFDAVQQLTNREQMVLGLLGRGVCNREISQTLGVTEKTVEKHVTSILRKLKLNSRTQVVRMLMDHMVMLPSNA